MRPRDIGTLALRLMGVYTLFLSVPHTFTWVGALMRSLDGDGASWTRWVALAVGGFLPGVLLVLVGVGLIVGAPMLGARLVRGMPDEPATGISGPDAQAIAFTVVGVLVVTRALPGLIQFGGASFGHFLRVDGGRLRFHNWWQLLSLAVQLGLGIGLFCGARGLAALWHRLRQPGLPPSARADDASLTAQSPNQ